MRDQKIEPDWNESGVPLCSDRCPAYDGKRCDVLGCRPDRICEPAVAHMAAELDILRSPGVTEKPAPRLLRQAEWARRSGVSAYVIRNAVRAGELQESRIGGGAYISEKDFVAWIERAHRRLG